MNYLKVLLLGVINTEPEDSIDYRIAHCLLEQIGELGRYNATQIAQLCHVSKAAVSRFCKHLGLEDFLDLQMLYRHFAVPEELKFLYEGRSEEGHLYQNYLGASLHLIEELERTIDENALMKLVDDIAAYKNVAVFGQMQSGNVALTLQHDMTAAKKYIYSSHRFGKQKEYILSADENTLILIFSATGEFFEHTFQSDIALRRKGRPKIYLITVTDTKRKPYIDEIINLCGRCDFATSVLALQQYASLIALYYHQKYGE